jgi:hypothetical protein
MTDDSVVTRVIVYQVRLGQDAAFQAWQKTVNDKARAFPGALRIDVLPSDITPASHEWVVVYRFSNAAQLDAWLGSKDRAQALANAPDILAGAAVEYTLSGVEGAGHAETIVTSNRVIPGKEADYAAADQALNEAAARFPGFLGTQVIKPGPGSDAWSTLIRFDSKENMDRWLASPERAAGRQKMYRYVISHHADVVPTGFGSWFAVNAEDSVQAPAWKQAMTVLAALFPTVMILNLTIGNFLTAEGASFPVNVFVGNVLGTVALTWLLMPVVTRLLAWWLSPSCPPEKTLLGVVLLLGLYGIELLVFNSLASLKLA